MGRTASMVLVVVGLLAAAAVVIAGGLDSRRDRSSGVVANALANAERGSSYLAEVRTRPGDPAGPGTASAWTTFGWSDEQGDLWLQSTHPLAGPGTQVTVVGGQARLGVDFRVGPRVDGVGDATWVDLGAGPEITGQLLFGTRGLTFRQLAQAVAEAEEDGSGWVAGTTAERYRVTFEPVTIGPGTATDATSTTPSTVRGEGAEAGPARTVRVTGGWVWLDDRERLAAVQLAITPVGTDDEATEELAVRHISDGGARSDDAVDDEAMIASPVVYVTPWESSVTAPPQPATTTSTTAP